MNQRAAPPRATRSRDWIPAAVRLAGRQFRMLIRMHLLMLVGVTAALTTIGSMPLFTHVADDAGLATYLQAHSDQGVITATAIGQNVTQTTLNHDTSVLSQVAQSTIAPYLTPGSYASIAPLEATLLHRMPNGALQPSQDRFSFTGVALPQFAPLLHISQLGAQHMPQGRLPDPASHELEMVLTQSSVALLGASVGNTIFVRFNDWDGSPYFVDLPVHLVGIIDDPHIPQQFWNDNSLMSMTVDAAHGTNTTYYKSLVSATTLLNILHQAAQAAPRGQQLVLPMRLYWLYIIQPGAFEVTQLPTISERFDTFQQAAISDLAANPDLRAILINGAVFDPNSLFTDYASRVSNAHVSLLPLYAGILGTILLFVVLLAEMLIEQQATAIAVLRSRGFGRGQLFAAQALQSGIVCGVSFALSIWLILPTARYLAQHLLPPHAQSATHVLAGSRLVVVAPVLGLLILVMVMTVGATFAALGSALRSTIADLRRATSRPPNAPRWQRLHLDAVAAVLAGISLSIALYVQYAVIGLHAQTDRMLAPLLLLAPIAAAMLVVLLFMRGSHVLLGLGAYIAQRGRGALAVLAFTHLQRAPRQLLRLTLFLSLAIGFAVFVLVFTASQTVRAADVAAQNVGADFSGAIIHQNAIDDANAITPTLALEMRDFAQVAGIQSVTIGHISTVAQTGSLQSPTFTLFAVDAHTYGNTAIWPPQDAVSVAALMQSLQLATSAKPTILPVIIDAQFANQMHVGNGDAFAVYDRSGFVAQTISCRVIAVVALIPQAQSGTGAMLADFSTYAAYVLQHGSGTITTDYAWLRTTNDPHTLAAIRAALHSADLPALATVNDRRAITAELQQDPLAVTLQGMLALCIIVPLALALITTGISMWNYLRPRLADLAILRALGASPRHVIAMLAWEQTLALVLAIVVGMIIGSLFAVTALPNVVLTNTLLTTANATSDQIYAAQHLPPVRMVFPITLWEIGAVVLLGGTIAIVVLQRSARTIAIGQSLRLNAD